MIANNYGMLVLFSETVLQKELDVHFSVRNNVQQNTAWRAQKTAWRAMRTLWITNKKKIALTPRQTLSASIFANVWIIFMNKEGEWNEKNHVHKK